MNLLEAARIALRGLRANRLRTGLTMLGIVIGISAVIMLVSLGNGLQTSFTEQFAALANQITISQDEGETEALDDGDVAALAEAPDVASVTPVVSGTEQLQRTGRNEYRASIVGSTADYLVTTDRELLVGSFFTDAQVRTDARVAVLGVNPVAELFDGDAGSAIGERVRIGRSSFEVIGVVESNGQQDDVAIVPLGAARSYVLGGADNVDSITVQARSSEVVDPAIAQVTEILLDRHNIADPDDADFSVRAQGSFLDNATQFLTYLQLFVAAIAGISLVVGGIGVANIMLVTVTERTREIGIRKAIGARRSAIMQQFLIESTVLAGIGGLIGIVVGVGVSVGTALVLPRFVPDFPEPEVSTWSVLLAFAVSLAIGLVAGGYPANRAARLHPIDALRYQ